MTAFLLCCSLFFLSACGASDSSEGSPAVTVTLIMDTAASPSFIRGAEDFSAYLKELSGGKMAVQTIYSSQPLQDVQQQEAALYFLSYGSARQQIPDLVALELPYLLDSMRMAGDVCSSLPMSSYINKKLEGTGLKSLAGVPYGQRYFVTRKKPFLSDKQEVVGFSFPYYSVNALPSLSENIRIADWDSLFKNHYLSGFEIPLWQIPIGQASSLKISPDAHSYDIGWIWANQLLMDSLSPLEQAWIQEAVVYTCGTVQESSLRSEQEILNRLLMTGMAQAEQPLYPSLKNLPTHNVTYKTCLDIDLLNLANTFYFE